MTMSQQLENLKQSSTGLPEINIIGHDNIDVDALLSGVLLSKLFNFLNIKSKFRIIQPIKKDDTFNIISELTTINMYDYEEKEESLNNLFLVDHYETTHNGNIIGCIDHHPTKKEHAYTFSYVRNSSATAYLIYELMKEANYPLTDVEAKMIIISMLVDTTAFKSSKAIPEEVKAAKNLAKRFKLDYDYLEKYCLCLTPIDQMKICEITSNGQKQYNYNGHIVTSAYLQLYGMPAIEIVNSWINHLNTVVTSRTSNTEYIFNTQNSQTIEYQITKRYTKKIIHNGILSRGKDIMPQVKRKYYDVCKEKIPNIIKKFSNAGYTIATMESCTCGSLAGTITNFSGASDILHESLR